MQTTGASSPQKQAAKNLGAIFLFVAVVFIGGGSWIDLPENPRISGKEASAVSSLRTLSTVSEQFQARFAAYPGFGSNNGLSDLAAASLAPPLIDAALGSGTKRGFTYTFVGGEETWSCVASPLHPDISLRSFFIDQSGGLRVEEDFFKNGPASAESSLLDEPPVE